MSDLIRRCDVLDNINKRIYYFDKASFDEAVKAVYNAPSVDAMPRWISVEERLPETREWVLVIGEFVPEGGWFVPHIAEYYIDNWRLDVEECSRPEDRSIKVTHWMPLPEPPKEE